MRTPDSGVQPLGRGTEAAMGIMYKEQDTAGQSAGHPPNTAGCTAPPNQSARAPVVALNAKARRVTLL